ncbi:helix-turn-helix transcriptional regulator [Sulfitobacter aestuarii]|uniref:Helix-turn-helix transcriptional regulator n=1 Tax=Sulfitobacter aestuarii TaxID=2161676 RepID=A0ABW5U0G3_9RHOB
MTGGDIQLLTLAQLSEGQDWRLSLIHDMPDHLMLWISRGQGRVLLHGQRRGIAMQDFLFVPCGALFSLELGRQGQGRAVLIPPGRASGPVPLPRHLRIRDLQAQVALGALLQDIQREAQEPLPLQDEALQAHVALLDIWLRRQLLQEEHALPRPNAATRLSIRFCTLLAQHYASGMTMAAYAAQLQVTPTHLTRALKTATGRSAAQLLTERVVHAARSLLADTSEPAQEIARRLGFGSAAYFTRFMQQHTGAPPSKLRLAPG